MSIEAMKLALEALKKCEDALAEELSAWDIDPPLHHVQESHDLCGPAIKALEEALANHIPDDTKMVSGVKDSLTTQQEQRKCNNCGEFGECCQKQEQGEPVGRIVQAFYEDGTPNPCNSIEWVGRNAEDDFPIGTKFYTTSQQRKPLTDEELRVIENKINPNMRWRSSDEEGITLYPQEYYELVRSIEAAHGIKE